MQQSFTHKIISPSAENKIIVSRIWICTKLLSKFAEKPRNLRFASGRENCSDCDSISIYIIPDILNNEKKTMLSFSLTK